MDIVREGQNFVIIHAGRAVDQTFPDAASALAWADLNIEDQVDDRPNSRDWFTGPAIPYRREPLRAPRLVVG